MRVKMIVAPTVKALENGINDFLKRTKDELIIDIKYQDNGNTTMSSATALIIMKY